MKKLVYILSVFLLTACYDDKGSYDYHDICEVTIEGIESVYEVIYRESTLEIDPKITVTEGDINDTTRFAYEWRANVAYNSTELLGTDRVLRYHVDLAPRDYILYFRVTDLQTDVVTVMTSTLKVGVAYSKGILLLGEDAQGYVDVQMLSMLNDTILYKDLLKDNGLPPLKNPVDIIHTGAANDSKYIKLWVLTKDQGYSLDRQTFAGSESDVFSDLLFLSRDYETEFVPVDIIPRVKDKSGNTGGFGGYYRAVVCNNGYIFSSYLGLMGGDYYNDPVNCLSTDVNTYYEAFPYLFYTLNNYGGFVWFDVQNKRFLKVGSFASNSSLMEDSADDPFPWNQGSTERMLVYGENGLNGGNSSGVSFAIMKDPAGSYYIYKFLATSNPTKESCYTITPVAANFEQAEHYAFSSRRTVVYYSVGSVLYAYDYNRGNEKLYTFDMGDPITMLSFDTTIEPSENPLYVATYNTINGGKLQKYIQDVHPDYVDLIPDETSCWTGLTKIKRMSWRAIQ